MKKIIFPFLLCFALIACEDDDSDEPQIVPVNNNGNTSCGDLKICFELEDSSYTSNVGMYHLDDTSYFAKFEGNGQQLSIDWFSATATTGTFPASDVKKQGMSRIYWFPDQTATQWMSDSGEVVITKHENKTVSATFGGRLQELVNGTPSGRTLIVKNGVFTNGKYF